MDAARLEPKFTSCLVPFLLILGACSSATPKEEAGALATVSASSPTSSAGAIPSAGMTASSSTSTGASSASASQVPPVPSASAQQSSTSTATSGTAAGTSSAGGSDTSMSASPSVSPTASGEPSVTASGAGSTPPPAGSTAFDGFPTVYDVEDTGADCPKPELPEYASLPEVAYLPDPFLKANGERMTRKDEWRCRRAEIRAMLEKYDVGEKPGKPSTFEASLQGNTLNITVGEGGNTIQLTAPIARPAGAASGPIPAIIGINTPTGSLPSNIFSSRGIATITFNSDQLAPGFGGSTTRSSGNFYKLYPNTTAGYMIRWAWGVSRIIDALEQLPEANIDLKHIAVSGCSFQGKIALYAGAFDERIALTIPHESGGGGTISWRYSDMLEKRDNTEVENLLHAQGAPWYAEALMQFNNNPNKLPFDHHELMAMVAPRALFPVESTAIARMGAEAARVDALAAREIWTALGFPFRLGVTEENTNHCVWHDGFTPDLEAYVDKYLLDKDVDTDILRSKFNIDTDTWIPWETPTLQ